MAAKRISYRGCLLGLAIGDAMGKAVDCRSLGEIREDYGPGGLQGYDLVNGYADISSYTQLAAFTCNGLLVGITRGQTRGTMAPFVQYIALASREWAASQNVWGRPDQNFCWLLRQTAMCRRNSMDTRMQDTLSRPRLGTLESPINNYNNPGSITTAVGVGLFSDKNRMGREETGRLGAEAVALTHGGAAAFLSGAVVAHIVRLLLHKQDLSLEKAFSTAATVMVEQFGHQYSQAYEIEKLIRHAIIFSQTKNLKGWEAMERLRCESAPQVLAGAVYASLACEGDFDRAMALAVNHSGRSAAVGALVGAFLGLRMGDSAFDEFYVKCLEPAEILLELADDLFQGCPMEMGNRMFDDDWTGKYIHGGRY
jgi:ADP-ribosylglycohydrolase